MQKITPHLWFDKEAGEAAEFYTSVFPGSRIKDTTTLHKTPSGSVDIVTIELLGQEFMLISAGPLSRRPYCNDKDKTAALDPKRCQNQSF